MKIAQIAPCWLSVPPNGYGGIEPLIAHLCNGLVDRGHEVTLFASGGSRTKANLESYYPEPPGMTEGVAKPLLELSHVLHAYQRAAAFDLIHDHSFPLGPSLGAQLSGPPVVHTVHGPPDHPDARPIYELIGRSINVVTISDYQQKALPGLNYVATVYNGIDVDAYRWQREKDDYLLFVGRICREKGAHVAVEVAARLGRRLIIAGKMKEPEEIRYFEAEVKPLLTDDIEFVGEADAETKSSLFAGAACTLMPIQWPEPFGLVMVESMASGTPVVALRNGSVPELIDHGVTGFVTDDVDTFTECVGRVGEIDPAECRRAVEMRFSKETMIDGYEKVYAALVG